MEGVGARDSVTSQLFKYDFSLLGNFILVPSTGISFN